jgi:hypothetical protein
MGRLETRWSGIREWRRGVDGTCGPKFVECRHDLVAGITLGSQFKRGSHRLVE